MKGGASLGERYSRHLRHRVIVMVAIAVTAAFVGLWHLYFQCDWSVKLFGYRRPLHAVNGLLEAAVAMWPFLISGIYTVRSVSSKYKDLWLSLAAAAGGAWAICAYDASIARGDINYVEFFELELVVLVGMAAVPHFFMGGLED